MIEDDLIGADSTAPETPSVTADDLAERLVRRRNEAYTRVFTAGVAASQDDINIVLVDLCRFGRVYEIAAKDPNWPLEILEGRRHVVLRIMEFAKLKTETLFRRYHQGG
jgi:hypothetical protein